MSRAGEVGTMPAMSEPIPARETPCVAVIGGATAGAEVAARLADRGALVAVFDQNPRPFGKIEDGLPRWHVNLRKKEYATIREKLGREGVHFVPNTKVGRDVDFAELVNDWGFTSVVLANGAWRDRSLPIDGIDAFTGRGLVYQNPFIIAFNHEEEPGYDGPRFAYPDGALVVGGGLASIDVAKVLMLETTRARLKERGLEASIGELETRGIPKILATHDLVFEDLGLAGCTILYRRDVEDMPLSEIPEGATPERAAKVRKGRRKILEKAMAKFCFTLEPLCAPETAIIEGDRLVGLGLRRTRIENGRVVTTDEVFERRGACVISSIGSIPEAIPGIDMKGELFDFSDWDVGRLEAWPTVFSVGNVVTGKGNIVASRKHAARVSQGAIEAFLGLGDGHAGEEALAGAVDEEATERVAQAASGVAGASDAERSALLERIAARQSAVGFDGFDAWMERHAPA